MTYVTPFESKHTDPVLPSGKAEKITIGPSTLNFAVRGGTFQHPSELALPGG